MDVRSRTSESATRVEHRPRAGLALALAALLIGASLAGAFHTHAPGAKPDGCAICSLVHMPASAASVDAGLGTPARNREQRVATCERVPDLSPLRRFSSRAPPLS